MLDEKLLDAVYASPFDDEALHDALGRLRSACDSRSAGVFHLGENGIDWELGNGIPAGFMARFAEQLADDPRIPWALSRPPLTVLDDSAPDLRRRMQASGTDSLTRHWDLPWTLATVCSSTRTGTWALFLSRSTGQGRADHTVQQAFAGYARHFARALRLRTQAQRHDRAWQNEEPTGSRQVWRLLVDSETRIRQLSPGAARLLDAADGIRIHRGRLQLTDPKITGQLQHLAAWLSTAPDVGQVDACFALPQHQPPGMLRIHLDPNPCRSIGGRRVLAVWLEGHTWARTACPAITPKAPTPRQLQVLRLLDSGQPTASIAQQLSIAESTVRTHIKHLLALTDSHNRRACLAVAREHGWLKATGVESGLFANVSGEAPKRS